jgi:DedD protein
MARNGNRGGGERVLESRHLVGLFLGVVLLCGVFFTLGYVMGRNQFGGSVHAAESLSRKPSSVKSREAEQPDATPDDFFPDKKDTDHLVPASPARSTASSNAPSRSNAAPPASTSKPAVPDAKSAQHYQAPVIPKAAILLQVAALRRQSDALEMADAIQQKKFPAFVVTPGPDNFYRVQVGPYPDVATAEAAKRALEQFGFKPIIKR